MQKSDLNNKTQKSSTSSTISSISSEVVDDDEPLILNETRIENETIPNKIKIRHRFFFAEITYFFFSFCSFPNDFITQKYCLDQITLKNWQYDLDHNITHNFDILNSSTITNSCAVNTSSDIYQFTERNQLEASHFLMIRTSFWIIPAMISNIVLGALSDDYGRRWVFIPPLLGSFSWSFLLCLITFFKADIHYIFISDFLSGAGGSFGCMILAAVAFVAGQTNSKNRLVRLTILQVFALIAASISPPIIGQLLEFLGQPITLLITCCISSFNVIYCIIFLPNHPSSKPCELQPPAEAEPSINGDLRLIQAANDETKVIQKNLFSIIKDQFTNTIELYNSNRKWVLKGHEIEIIKTEDINEYALESGKHHIISNNAVRLRFLLLGFFMTCIPLFDPTAVLNLYLLNIPLCWDQGTIGYYTGLSTFVCAVGSVSLTRLFEICFDRPSIAIICCAVCAISRIYIFFVKNTLMMFLGIAFLPLTNIVLPTVRTMMTLLVPDSKHGSVLGSLGSVEVFCCYAAYIIFNEVYSATLYISTAFVFLVSGSILIVGLVIFLIYQTRFRNDIPIHFTDSIAIPA